MNFFEDLLKMISKPEEDEDDDECIFKDIGVPEIIEGPVVMTRSPCHLPSDIQCFRAVDNPQVRANHLTDNVNVIVFSSQGDRPAFNKMSNGDLDGDTYFVCWDQDIVSHFDPDFSNEVNDELQE